MLAVFGSRYTVPDQINRVCNRTLIVYASYHSRLDVVVTDVDMPQMGGIELAARINGMIPSKRIVLMTGSILERVPEYCTLLTKPFRPDELIAAVQGVQKA